MKKLSQTFIIIILLFFSSGQAQLSKQNRFPKQKHFEDSLYVFWTYYPNPFSPPTVTDTSKGFILGNFSFYCDLSENVEVAFVTSNDSIVNRIMVTSKNAPHFTVGYWVAGPNIKRQSLPGNYFKSNFDGNLKMLLIVGDKRKSLRQIGIPVKRGWYYWIDDIYN